MDAIVSKAISMATKVIEEAVTNMLGRNGFNVGTP
jgi:Ca2+/Na+ antiporter